jgi:hypothetical protein
VDKLFGVGMTPKTESGTHGVMGGTVQEYVKGASPQKTENDQTQYREMNYDDPELQRQLATLQLLDLITGQVDRHPGNYYVYQGPEGTKVIAIDNDLSFGKDKGIDRVQDDIWKRPLAQDNSRGYPLFVDETVAQQMLNTSPQQLKTVLKGMVDPQEIDQALVRFGQVKSYLRQLKTNTSRISRVQSQLGQYYQRKSSLAKGSLGLEALNEQIHHLEGQIPILFGKGALLPSDGWGAYTAAYLTHDNSYYGVLMAQVEYHRSANKMVKDEAPTGQDNNPGK